MKNILLLLDRHHDHSDNLDHNLSHHHHHHLENNLDQLDYHPNHFNLHLDPHHDCLDHHDHLDHHHYNLGHQIDHLDHHYNQLF